MLLNKLAEQVLEYSAMLLETKLSEFGTWLPHSRVLALSMRGRAFAALGRTADAATALEAAAEEAHRYQLHLFEAFAFIDLFAFTLSI